MKLSMIWTLGLSLLAVVGMSRAASGGDETHTLDFGGLKRSYTLHLPATDSRFDNVLAQIGRRGGRRLFWPKVIQDLEYFGSPHN